MFIFVIMQTCVSCNTKNNGMIAIYHHPNELDEMFQSVTGIQVRPKDHLCVPCYDEMKSAHRFKQRCIQNNVLRLSIESSKNPVSSSLEQRVTCTSGVSTTCPETCKDDEVHQTVRQEINTYENCETDITTSNTKRKDECFKKAVKNSNIILYIDNEQHHYDEPPSNEEPEQQEQVEEYTLMHVVPMEKEDGASLHEAGFRDDTDTAKDNALLDVPNNQNVEQKREDENSTRISPRLPKVHSLMCEYCFQEFDQLTDKIEHSDTHQAEPKPFKCIHAGCNGSFKDRVGLRAHVRIHASVKRYACRYCSMRFHTLGNRNAHERTHNGEKPYICPKCGKGFAEAGNLKNHIRFHNGERPYPCSICDKAYRTHYSRSVHMRSHTNERPFACDDCGKSFFSSGKLTIHRRIHTGERPYECSSCPARFTDTCGLRRHVVKVH
ncbi:zinc finger protein 771-like [Anopheles nili]|uniref:zinc finger protein 771-like n=1 Tax=Anopheles nili TaxID=185578 RepID=UPI00237AA3F2|nr:zinc finger protein 771-like [Anopheles nili]